MGKNKGEKEQKLPKKTIQEFKEDNRLKKSKQMVKSKTN
jgi:hypothetical protein